jgi:hypothetical protein
VLLRNFVDGGHAANRKVTPSMTKCIKVMIHSLFFCGLLILLLLPHNKYAWMTEIDPSATVQPSDLSSDNHAVFAALVLVAIVNAQLLLAFMATQKKQKRCSYALALLACLIWWLRF